jgi:hypothetical protein
MPKLLLICKNPSTALESVSAILRNTPDDLIKSLRQLNITAQDRNDDIELSIKNRFLKTGNFEDFDAAGFHGTRLSKSHTIMEDGILPTSQVKRKMQDYLQHLGKGLTKIGVSLVGCSYATKNFGNYIDEGPFGCLFYEVAAYPSGTNGKFIECPELIADLAGEMFGENSIHLINRFKQDSHSYIIHFRYSPCDKIKTLSRALLYTYLTQVVKQESRQAANSNPDWFDGKGAPVKPGMIIEIERIANTYAV